MSIRSRAIATGVALLVTVPACGTSDDGEAEPPVQTPRASTTTAVATVPFDDPETTALLDDLVASIRFTDG